MRRRAIAPMIAIAALAQLAPAVARAADVQSNSMLLGQVRESDPLFETEAPFWLYSDLSINRLHHGISGEGFFSLNEDFGPNTGGGDFFAGMVRIPSAFQLLDFSLGRQFLGEGPRGGNDADSGRITLDGTEAGTPLAVSVFGGAPRYFEPTFSSPSISQDEQMFGGRVLAKQLPDAYANLGFLQYMRNGDTLSQLLQLNMGKTFGQFPTAPNVYSSFSYDALNESVYQAIGGLQTFLLIPQLRYSLDAAYYDPAGTGVNVIANPNLRQDPLYDVFASGGEMRYRNTLAYIFSNALSVYGNFAYQRYKNTVIFDRGVYTNGYIGSAGLNWLPGGDGLETVRVEYYTAESASAGGVNGGRFIYNNFVYDRIHFDLLADVAYYQKLNNEKNTAVATRMGLGYDLLPGLYTEAYMEGNRNERFNADIRFGLSIVYNWSYRFGQQSAPAAQAVGSGESQGAYPAGSAYPRGAGYSPGEGA